MEELIWIALSSVRGKIGIVPRWCSGVMELRLSAGRRVEIAQLWPLCTLVVSCALVSITGALSPADLVCRQLVSNCLCIVFQRLPYSSA